MSEEIKNETVETKEVATETNEEKQGKYYTQEEIDLMIQKAGDKRISQYQKTMERKQRESEKLHNMSETDKREYLLEERERAIEAKENELAMLENKSEGISILTDKGIDAKLIDLVINSDSEVMYSNIKLLEQCFKKSVKAEVEKRLASKSPTQSLPMTTAITKEQFKKMSMTELMQLKMEQPELFEELKKQ